MSSPAGRRLPRPGRRAVATVGLLLAGRDSSVPAVGPLVISGVAQASGFKRDPGEPVTFAGIELYNSGTRAATLERVTLDDPDPAILIVGTFAAPRPRGAFVVAYREFPPGKDDVPAQVTAYPDLGPVGGLVVRPQPGATLETAATTQLYVGLASTAPEGKAKLESFRVHYRVAGRRYELVVPHAVTICTPRRAWTSGPCPATLPGANDEGL